MPTPELMSKTSAEAAQQSEAVQQFENVLPAVLTDLLDHLPVRDIARLQLAIRPAYAAVTEQKARILLRRGLHPSMSLLKAHALETAMFADLVGDPGMWMPGPNDTSECNFLERHFENAADDSLMQPEPWLQLRGGTDWQGFQGGFRKISDTGARPAWISFRVRVATPESSCAFLTLAAGQKNWGLVDPVLCFSYRGDESMKGRRCFSFQTGATQYGDALHFCHINPEFAANRPFDIAVNLDWHAKKMSVYIDRVEHISQVHFKAGEPIRFAAIYNWRSEAVASFSELIMGQSCPFSLPSTKSERGSSAINRRCRCPARNGMKFQPTSILTGWPLVATSVMLVAVAMASQLLLPTV